MAKPDQNKIEVMTELAGKYNPENPQARQKAGLEKYKDLTRERIVGVRTAYADTLPAGFNEAAA